MERGLVWGGESRAPRRLWAFMRLSACLVALVAAGRLGTSLLEQEAQQREQPPVEEEYVKTDYDLINDMVLASQRTKNPEPVDRLNEVIAVHETGHTEQNEPGTIENPLYFDIDGRKFVAGKNSSLNKGDLVIWKREEVRLCTARDARPSLQPVYLGQEVTGGFEADDTGVFRYGEAVVAEKCQRPYSLNELSPRELT